MGEKIESASNELVEILSTAINQRIDEAIEKQTVRVDEAIANIGQTRPLEIRFRKHTTTITDRTHVQFPDLLNFVSRGLDVLITGGAGTGKTHAARQVAEALSLPFYCQSVGAQTSKSDLLGYMDATGMYVKSNFRRAYEEGGVFVMDEIDAGNANVLIVLNSALSNNVCAFPDEMVKRHEDFKFIATANTYGQGASREYVGRNQLDAATLDRFVVVNWGIDHELERQMVAPYLYGEIWLEFVRATRTWVYAEDIKAIISPRITLQGAIMLEPDNGHSYVPAKEYMRTVCQATIGKTIPASNYLQLCSRLDEFYMKNVEELDKIAESYKGKK